MRSRAPPESVSPPLVAPLELSSVYCPEDLDHVDALSEGRSNGFIYARDGHPNAAQLAEKIAHLEGGDAGLICASGMGAIASTFLAFLSQNDHALVSDGVYGRTTALVTRLLPRWGIGHDIFDPAADPATVKSLLKPETRLIYAKTASNPLLRVADLDSLATVARQAGIPLIVDNTFTPVICRPMDHGARLVVHSVTKMIGGHSDLTLGAIVGAKNLVSEAKVVASTLGQTGNPFESWMPCGHGDSCLRFKRACESSLKLAAPV